MLRKKPQSRLFREGNNMGNFHILTDSCANLSQSYIEQHGLEILSLSYLLDGVETIDYVKGKKIDYSDFYGQMTWFFPSQVRLMIHWTRLYMVIT